MKIKTFSELREAAKDKAAKAQTTTKDKESDLFGTSRIKGEQDFRDAHGMDVQIKANKLKDDNHFSPNLKPATHRADGEKQPIRQGNSSQPGPTKLFQVKEEEQIYENKITHIIPKKHLEDHKDWMDSEGYHTETQELPKGHPKHKTHVGIVSDNSVESSYHEDGMAVPIKEEEQIEMNEDVFSSLKALASSNKSGNLKFKNGETGLVNSKSAGKIVDAYNKLSPENAKQMKSKMNSDVVGFMKVLHFVDKSAKAV